MLGQPTPNDADPTGEWYAFEKGAGKAEGGEGFADVWMRDHFAWEYKGKRKDTRPTWLAQAHERLDAPVLAAYGWPADLDRDELLARLLALNLARAENRSDR